jgi:hypothetical protein
MPITEIGYNWSYLAAINRILVSIMANTRNGFACSAKRTGRHHQVETRHVRDEERAARAKVLQGKRPLELAIPIVTV